MKDDDKVRYASKKAKPLSQVVVQDEPGKGANPRKTNNGETTSMLTTVQKRLGSLSFFDQLKAKAEAKNLDLVRHPKSGFRVFFKDSNSTIHAGDRLYGLTCVQRAIDEHTPVDTH